MNTNGATEHKRKRRYFKIRRIMSVLSVILFCCALIVVGALAALSKKPEYSESERRMLAPAPELTVSAVLSGSYTKDLGIYFSDTFFRRDFLVGASFFLADRRGLRYDSIKIYSAQDDSADEPIFLQLPELPAQGEITRNPDGTAAFPGKTGPDTRGDPAGDFPDSPPSSAIPEPRRSDGETEETSQGTPPPQSEGEKRNGLFLIGGSALEIFKGTSSMANAYADAVNYYRDILPDDVVVYDLVVPTHTEFGLPKKYSEISNPQSTVIDEIYARLDSRIRAVNAYDLLEEHYQSGEYLYFHTDHHWTGLGAYYAYKAFISQAGFDAVAYESYEKATKSPFLGTLYQSTKDSALKSNPDYVEVCLFQFPYTQRNLNKKGETYAGKLTYQTVEGEGNGYLLFMGGDEPYIKITTENKNGRKLFVFKESFGNAFIPYLAAHYEEIHVADIRTFPFHPVRFIADNEINEVLFINGIMSACTPARIQNMLDLLAIPAQ